MYTRRILNVATIVVFLAVRAISIELPTPPDGFSWQEIPAIKAAILTPEGWYYHEEKRGKTLAIFVTKEHIPTKKFFETGATVNVFLDNPSAPSQVIKMVEDAAAKNSVEVSRSSFDVFIRLDVMFDSPRPEGKEPARTVISGIINKDTRTSYLLIFETPISTWKEFWPKGQFILDFFAFESEI
jgi:hypothetical protein